MRRVTAVAVFSLLFVPALMFAQTQAARDTAALKKLGLSDAQVTQVLDIQNKTQAIVQKDRVSLRLSRDQIDQALLAANPDIKAINTLVDQASQTRADMQKALLGARVQLRQIMGADNLQAYMKAIRGRQRKNVPGRQPWRQQGGI